VCVLARVLPTPHPHTRQFVQLADGNTCTKADAKTCVLTAAGDGEFNNWTVARLDGVDGEVFVGVATSGVAPGSWVNVAGGFGYSSHGLLGSGAGCVVLSIWLHQNFFLVVGTQLYTQTLSDDLHSSTIARQRQAQQIDANNYCSASTS
jgi:hypothetical protein